MESPFTRLRRLEALARDQEERLANAEREIELLVSLASPEDMTALRARIAQAAYEEGLPEGAAALEEDLGIAAPAPISARPG